MGSRLFNIPAISRALGFALLAIAIVVAAYHFRHEAHHRLSSSSQPAAPADLLTAELGSCQTLAMAAKEEADCEATWVQNRRQFFTDAPAMMPAPAAVPLTSDK